MALVANHLMRLMQSPEIQIRLFSKRALCKGVLMQSLEVEVGHLAEALRAMSLLGRETLHYLMQSPFTSAPSK